LATNFVRKDAVVQEIGDMADTLENFYNRILNGFTRAPVPGPRDISYLPAAPFPGFTSAFDPEPPPPLPRVFGIIDAYEGDGLLASYPADVYPNTQAGPFHRPRPDDPTYLEFIARYELGNRRLEKELYVAIGLDKVWETLQDLRRAAGQPTETFDTRLYWSVRDILVALGAADADIIDQRPGSPPPDLSLLDTYRRLAIIGKVDDTGLLLVSLRDALKAATP
jgi:hypothetical protein